ncbi:sensor histidine kinase [Spirosoma linguale]|uniref:ATP-binding region ATPase domain protein n=1 Tax=Spirosoma linguale (strain ATCC 33905 / DSM 74 / LMG 10896 / Claus 1) TaxID=504472 RepID=D2QUG5_SPILD|nr:ATP-binding region ATPase domain protein [Spirosoma linguale DSM 74]
MNWIARFTVLLVLASTTSHVYGGKPIQLSSKSTYCPIGRQADYLVDTNGRITFQYALILAKKNHFKPLQQDVANMVKTDAGYWFRFSISVQSQPVDTDYLFEVGFGNIKHISLYLIDQHGNLTTSQAGDQLERASRPVSFHTYVFPLPVKPGNTYNVFVHIDNQNVHSFFPMAIWEQKAFMTHSQRSALLWGFYWGFLCLMFLYHIVIWIFTRTQGYMYLAAYLAAYMFYEAARGSNIGARYLWPQSFWLMEHSLSIFSVGVIITFTLFYSKVLNLQKSLPVLRYILLIMCSISVILLVSSLSTPINTSSQFIAILSSFPLVLIMFLAGLITWFRGLKAARFYVVASICYAIGFTVFVLNRTNVLPGMNFLIHYSQNIGSLLEFVFMSIGLADFVRHERRSRQLESHQREQLEKQMLKERLRQKTDLEEALIHGQIQERQRVANELHDQLGSVLFGLRIGFDKLKVDTKTTDGQEVVSSLLQTVQSAYEEVRLISHNLWPSELEERGFGHTLNRLIGTLNSQAKTHFVLQLSGQEEELGRIAKFHLYCICLELINNILKHAQADEATIRFTTDLNSATLRLSIRDDGVGMDNSMSATGRGLQSIHERVKLLQGSIRFTSLPEGVGTWVQISIPCVL